LVSDGAGADTGKGSTAQLDVARRAKLIRKVAFVWGANLTAIAQCSKPVVAAIHGPCIGAGLEVAIAADVRHCSSDAYFSIREVRIGLAADMGSLQRVPKIMANDSLVRELAFSGRDMKAPDALKHGLVSHVLPEAGAEAVLESALQLAKEIAANSPVAVQGTKAGLNYSRDRTVAEGLEFMAIWNQSMVQSDDLVKAAMATASRSTEPPVFDDL